MRRIGLKHGGGVKLWRRVVHDSVQIESREIKWTVTVILRSLGKAGMLMERSLSRPERWSRCLRSSGGARTAPDRCAQIERVVTFRRLLLPTDSAVHRVGRKVADV